MNNFIKRDLVPRAEKRGSKIEQLLNGLKENADKAERGREDTEEERQDQGRRGLPFRGRFGRRQIN